MESDNWKIGGRQCVRIQTQEFSMSIIRDADVIEDGHHRISSHWLTVKTDILVPYLPNERIVAYYKNREPN